MSSAPGRPQSVAEYMPGAVLETSRGSDWHGVEIMLARLAQPELAIDRLPTHTIAINVGRPYRLEGRIDGHRTDGWMSTEAIKIVPAGPRSNWQWDAGEAIDMLHVSVGAGELRAHAAELGVNGEPELVTRVGFADRELPRTARALLGELRAAGAGTLATDALRIELVIRLLADHSSLAATGAIRLPAQRLGASTLRRLDEYIDAHLGSRIGVTELAALAGVSRFHFARMFRATTGRTPHRYVLERRIDRARRLLQHSSLSIGDVAAATGFADQSHLTRHVKRQYGITPSAYRVS